MPLQHNFNHTAFQPRWITQKIDSDGITYLENLGYYLCDKKDEKDRPGFNAVTTSQLRNIFSEVKRIEVKLAGDEKSWDDMATAVLLLQPKIAYNTARVLAKSHNSRMKDLRAILEKALTSVKDADDFRRFSQFMEGIIAYHKVYGGKD